MMKKYLNQKTFAIAGISIVILLGVVFLRTTKIRQPLNTEQNATVTDLAYCNADQVKPCIVSFGTDVNDHMLVNILLPNLSFPAFHLKVTRGENMFEYKCQRTSTAVNNAYCVGDKLSPGEVFHFALISTKDGTLMAEGDITIIGLAFPELKDTAPPTSQPTMTVSPTPQSYPNPSYP